MYRPLMNPCLCALLISAAALTHPSLASVIYEDSFTGAAGTALNGRAPDQQSLDGNTYRGSPTLRLNGNGQAFGGNIKADINNTGPVAVSLPLPPLSAGEVVTLTLDFSASGGNATYVALGFTNREGTLSNPAASEIRAVIRSDALGRVYVGIKEVFLNNSERFVSASTIPGGSRTALVRLVMTYTAATGELQVTATDKSKNITKTLYQGPSDNINLEALKFATFQFHSQNTDSSPYPAGVDYFKVEVTTAP